MGRRLAAVVWVVGLLSVGCSVSVGPESWERWGVGRVKILESGVPASVEVGGYSRGTNRVRGLPGPEPGSGVGGEGRGGATPLGPGR